MSKKRPFLSHRYRDIPPVVVDSNESAILTGFSAKRKYDQLKKDSKGGRNKAVLELESNLRAGYYRTANMDTAVWLAFDNRNGDFKVSKFHNDASAAVWLGIN